MMITNNTDGLLTPYLMKKRFNKARPYLIGRVLDYGCGIGGLASYVLKENYLGFDIDASSVQMAQKLHPEHRFVSSPPIETNSFDTVVSLAVIEHVIAPSDFIQTLGSFLRVDVNARIVLTTPHPVGRIIHDIGSKLGFFCRLASETHGCFLDKNSIIKIFRDVKMNINMYKKFFLFTNQIILLERQKNEIFN